MFCTEIFYILVTMIATAEISVNNFMLQKQEREESNKLLNSFLPTNIFGKIAGK